MRQRIQRFRYLILNVVVALCDHGCRLQSSSDTMQTSGHMHQTATSYAIGGSDPLVLANNLALRPTLRIPDAQEQLVQFRTGQG